MVYANSPFEQHCPVPEVLGCELTEEGYIWIDASQKTSIDGIFACGDNVTRLRTVANAIAMGTATGMIVNKEIIFWKF
jgi:thioredoxin reductase